MKKIKLLILEDKDRDFDIVEKSIIDFNEERNDGFQIEYDRCKSYSEAKTKISAQNYDCAIIDIKIEGEKEGGDDLVKDIFDSKSVLTFVLSGTTNYVDDHRGDQNHFFKIYTKGEKLVDEILEEILELFKTGVTELFGEGELVKKVRELLHQVFWKNISHSIDYWIDSEMREGLFRFASSHIVEAFQYDSEGFFEEYHPAEMIITPPISPKLHTGDVIQMNGGEYIIMSPACDMVIQPGTSERRAEKIALVKIIKIENLVDLGENESLANLSNSKKSNLQKLTKKDRYYGTFIPKYGRIGGGLLDFQEVVFVLGTQLEAEISSGDSFHHGRIVNSFMKDIIQKFSHYYSRQGTPVINQEILLRNILS